MKNRSRAAAVLLPLALLFGAAAGAQRPPQSERQTERQRRKPKLQPRRADVKPPAKPLLSRMEKLAHPKDKAQAFDFKVEVVDLGGLDVVDRKFSDDLKSLLVTVRNKGVSTPKEEAHLFVYVYHFKLIGSAIALPFPVSEFMEGTKLPPLKPNEEFVYALDLAKHGVKLIPAGASYDLQDGYPKIAVECYLVSGSFDMKL